VGTSSTEAERVRVTLQKIYTEHINGLELFLRERDHLSEKWETLNPNGTKTRFEFELTRKM
jgi:hypothetical protein